jgi:hypothetical protein
MLRHLPAFHVYRELVFVFMFVDTLFRSLVPLVVWYEEVFRHGDQPNGSKEKCERDRLGHDAHDIFSYQLFLLQSILTILVISSRFDSVKGLTLVGR